MRDFLRLLRRRYANLEVLIYPVKVQGLEAAGEIVRALEDLAAYPGVEVIVLARGGGSLEDLWPFNEEKVAWAIHRCPIPVVSAVGHEVDFTIADFVADVRAATPSAAVESVVPDKAELKRRLDRLGATLAGAFKKRRETARRHLGPDVPATAGYEPAPGGFAPQSGRAGRDPGAADPAAGGGAAAAAAPGHLPPGALEPPAGPGPLAPAPGAGRAAAGAELLPGPGRPQRRHLEYCQSHLDKLNPLAILQRGYAVATLLPAETVIRDAAQAPPGAAVRVRVARGRLDCEVQEVSGE